MGEGEEKKAEGGECANNGSEDEIVLKVDMHCEACAQKVSRILRSFPGVEDVGVDRKANTVAVKVGSGKTVEAGQLCERVEKKSGRKAQIICPLPKPQPPVQPQPRDDNQNQLDQAPPVITVVLQVHMHCEACAQILRKRIRKINGIESVETDVGKDQVTVKGAIADPTTLVKQVYKRTRKHASIIVPNEDKKQDEAPDQNKKGGQDSETKKETHGRGSVNQEPQTDYNKMAIMGEPINRYEYYWPTMYNYNVDYYNHNIVSYPPQVFSDENPNACSIM